MIVLKEATNTRKRFIWKPDQDASGTSRKIIESPEIVSTTKVFPIKEKETWFVMDSTKMNCYMTCPRLLFFEHILGLRLEGNNINLIFGSAWHIAREIMLLGGYNQETIEKAKQALADYYSNYYPELMWLDNSPKDPKTANKAIDLYVDMYSKVDTFKCLYTEILVPIPISDTRILYTKMDSININSRSQYFSLEHKTTKQESSYLHDQWLQAFQIDAYYHTLVMQYGFENVYGIVVENSIFRKGSKGIAHIRTVIQKDKLQLQDWLIRANQYMDEFEKDMREFRETTIDDPIMTCFRKKTTSCIRYNKICPMFHICNAYPNPIQLAGNIPVNYIEEFWDPRTADEQGNKFTNFLDFYNKAVIVRETNNEKG